MAEFKNTFSWSKSRDGTFKSCKRKYFYNYYASWGGWDAASDRRTRQIYILKNLQTRQIWLGSCVHEFIESILTRTRSGYEADLYRMLGNIKSVMQEDFENSKKGLYAKYPKIHGRTYGLLEHEYDILITTDELKDILENAGNCITNFYNSDTFNYIRSVERKNWKQIESLRTFDFEGTDVYVVIDFAMSGGKKDLSEIKPELRNLTLAEYDSKTGYGNIKNKSEYDSYSDENLIIFDWKTGRVRFEEKETMNVQLACYSLYSQKKWSVSPENIICKKYNVMIDKVDDYEINDAVIDKVKDYMRESINDMKELLCDKENNIAQEEDFSVTDDDNVCRWCNFRKICSKWE